MRSLTLDQYLDFCMACIAEFLAWELLVLFCKFFLACVPVFATERIFADETRASSYHVEANEQKNSRVTGQRLLCRVDDV